MNGLRRYVATAVALLLTSATLVVGTESATAVVANVAISATTASNGTRTLGYRATVTRAGTLRYIVVSIPPTTISPRQRFSLAMHSERSRPWTISLPARLS